MKLFIPQIDDTIICDKDVCTSLIIENPNVWCSICGFYVFYELRGNGYER